jgi:carbamoylphosphate synthase small subunit
VGRLLRSLLLYWYDGVSGNFYDPSYFQIMVATNAHIGNYGVNENEVVRIRWDKDIRFGL